ncbi:MAG: lysophospholipid acyltransferase family protein [Verrucomicrobiota bacterium]|nr:lysophospholipid acyltransferase family protein [Verrucomicrobiota bacterium]
MQKRLPNESSVSRWAVEWFGRYSARYVRRHFHRVRLLRTGIPRSVTGLPLVVYLNHASWWDPLVCLLLARRFFGARQSFAPIDAKALGRYRFFTRLGFFPVDEGAAGAREFLRRSDNILASPTNALWITPQGKFADVRERPLHFERGLSHIAGRVPRAAFLPLAIEYPFWEERFPEVLVSFGEPVVMGNNDGLSVSETTHLFEGALVTVQDHLSAAALRRDGREWMTLLGGREGVGGVYQTWNRARAKSRGKSYSVAHSKL